MAAFLLLEACFEGLPQLLGSFAVFGRMRMRSVVRRGALGRVEGISSISAMTRIGPLHFGHCSYSAPGIQERVESHRSTTIQQFLL